MRRVLICGGGIGGLTAALALHKAGIEAEVYEAVPEIRPLGVGINLLPHAVRVLTGLGLAAELEREGVATAELLYFNKFGQRIWREPRGLAAGYAWPQYSIHRGALQTILLRAAAARGIPVHTGCALERFDGARARFANGRTAAAAALVGADGIHSVVRRAFYPAEGEPKASGRILWRAVTPGVTFLTGRSMIMAGNADIKFVCYPIGREKPLVNWIAERNLGPDAALPKRDWNRRAAKEVFAPFFETWRFDWLDVPALISGAAEVFEFPMVDRDPVPRWSFGPVTLLGDAAHPMYPIGSNGASQAILDAGALAAALAEWQDVEHALRVYEQARLAPASAIVESNRRLGPEVVMQIVEERAPHGFSRLSDVISDAELERAAQSYKVTAGFDKESLEPRRKPL